MVRILETKNLCKTYIANKRRNNVLKNINFSVDEGEMVAVMGPSGSGKSTLLYTVSGMDGMTAGEVTFCGKNMGTLSSKELAGLRLEKMGFIFQQLQRACICRSMINHPKMIFADEPTGALNRSSSDGVMDELAKINAEGTTIMLVTHDVKVAAKCTRVLYLVDGSIQGEYTMDGNLSDASLRERERSLNHWLMEMGW